MYLYPRHRRGSRPEPPPGSDRRARATREVLVRILFFVVFLSLPIVSILLRRPEIVADLLDRFRGDALSHRYVEDVDDPDRYRHCRRDDARENSDCARVVMENSLRAYWEDKIGDAFRPATIRTYWARARTGCGHLGKPNPAFYCPGDHGIYVAATPPGGGPWKDRTTAFLEPYDDAHQYGHHIQGLLEPQRRTTSAESHTDMVRRELQADCYAGMWTAVAISADERYGVPTLEGLTDEEIRRVITVHTRAAAQVKRGDQFVLDDGLLTPEQPVRASAESRIRWFRIGQEQGSVEACDP